MKRLLVLPIILLICTTSAIAQNPGYPGGLPTRIPEQLLEELDVDESDREEIRAVQEETRKLKEETELEINLIRAQLARLLYYPDPDMREVEKQLDRSSELRLEMEKAQIRAYVRIRQILGEETWEDMLRIIRAARAQAERRQPGQQGPRTGTESRQPGPTGSGSG